MEMKNENLKEMILKLTQKDIDELSYVHPEVKYYMVKGNCDFFDRNHDEENMLIQISFPYNRLQNTSEFETPYNFRRNKPPFSVLHNPLTIK